MKRLLAGLSAAVFSIQSWAIEIGYMPILPVSQLFVGLEQGELNDLAPEAKLIQFQNGPAMVQALLGGQLDVAYLGIGPAMVAKAKGADIKVVASNIVEQISVVALPDLAESLSRAIWRAVLLDLKPSMGASRSLQPFRRAVCRTRC